MSLLQWFVDKDIIQSIQQSRKATTQNHTKHYVTYIQFPIQACFSVDCTFVSPYRMCMAKNVLPGNSQSS